MNKLVFLEPTMKATDEQIERVRELSKYSHGLHAEEALAAVLAELTALRKLAEAVEASPIALTDAVVDAALAEARK